MAANIYAYLQTFTWNSNTWNEGTGGPIRLEIMAAGQVLEEGTGSDFFATYCRAVMMPVRCRVTLTDESLAGTLAGQINVRNNAVATLLAKQGGSTAAINLAGMVLLSIDPIEQTRLQRGGITLLFGYESTDGQTTCIS